MSPQQSTQRAIRIRGARTHNLKNVDVDLPLGKLVVVTGVSGSGKSSLAFDTLFAEGQRRYLDSVSNYTRSLIKQLARPSVDEISDLPPTVSVDQRMTAAPARSTLAVTTEIYDYLRLLYARAGSAHCTECGDTVSSQSIDAIVDRIMAKPERSKLMLLSPMVRQRKGAHKDVFERIGRNGFVRARVDGELLDISDPPDLKATVEHTIDAVVDRIIVKPGIEVRLRESIGLAVRESDGTCILCEQIDGVWHDRLFSTRFSCATCDISFPTPETRTFSFNSAWGACPACEGFGRRGIVDDSDDITVFRQAACDQCGGSRLQPFARNVTFDGTRIAEFTSLSVIDALLLTNRWLGQLDRVSLPVEHRLVAEKTLPDIRQRLECLSDVGVGYLNLDRVTRTLSGGEFQRARLAACLGTGLHGACYVLDEPTSGLHARDTQQLLQTLINLRDDGASVIVVEHDPDVMLAADCLVDLGPGAGTEGGHLQFCGAPADCATTADSPTARYLRHELNAPAPAPADVTVAQPALIEILGAKRNNLQDVSVSFPLNQLVCVTGVSGSGKSSLILDTLLPVAVTQFSKHGDVQFALADAECHAVKGLDGIDRVVSVDNRPLGKNRRSCIATYSQLWNEVRKLFAKTREAKARGFAGNRFSFNSGPGRCDVCKGTGQQDVKMTFLPNVTVPCPECNGSRFNRATLAVKYRDHNADDLLQMSLSDAADFFSELASIRKIIDPFVDVGLGYLKLGQPSNTFSGGEAQRVKLATELTTKLTLKTLFILDEPTSGLHPADVIRLIQVLQKLVAAGNSVVVVEHNTDVMRSSQWLIDIGLESGPAGGNVLYQGQLPGLLKCSESHTAKFLGSP